MMAANIAVVIDASKAANKPVDRELNPAEHLTAFAESLWRPVFHYSDSQLWITQFTGVTRARMSGTSSTRYRPPSQVRIHTGRSGCDNDASRSTAEGSAQA